MYNENYWSPKKLKSEFDYQHRQGTVPNSERKSNPNYIQKTIGLRKFKFDENAFQFCFVAKTRFKPKTMLTAITSQLRMQNNYVQ